MKNVMTILMLVAVIGLTAGLVQADPTPDIWLKFENNLTNSGTATATITQADGPEGTSAYVAGKVGQAMDLNLVGVPGVARDGDHITVSDYTLADQGTIAMWYYVESPYHYQTIFDNQVHQDYWKCHVYAGDEVAVFIDGGTANRVLYDLDNLDGPQNWYHIAFTWDRDDVDDTKVYQDLYVDGVSRDTCTGTWVNPSTFNLGGGRDHVDDGNGTWDEVRIYDEVLTSTEINNLIPEPATMTLLVLGLPFALRRKRK